MNTEFIINKEKQTVTCKMEVINKLVNDANRYSFDPPDFPFYVCGVARLRGEDEFDAETGKRVALAKAEKEYLNNLLNTRGWGLRPYLKRITHAIEKCDELLSTLIKTKAGIMTAIEHEVVGTVPDRARVSSDEKTGVTVLRSIPLCLFKSSTTENLREVLIPEDFLNLIYRDVVGVAKLNKDIDKYDKEKGISIAFHKVNLAAINQAIAAVKARKKHLLSTALDCQQSILAVEKRRDFVIENLKTF